MNVLRLLAPIALVVLVAGCSGDEDGKPAETKSPVAARPARAEPVKPAPPKPVVDVAKVHELLEKTRFKNPTEVKKAAAEELSRMGEPIIPTLIKAMKARDTKWLGGAKAALAGMGAVAIPALEKMAVSNRRRRESVANTLLEMGDEGRAVIDRLLVHDDLHLRAAVAWRMTSSGLPVTDRMIKAMIPCLGTNIGDALLNSMSVLRQGGPAAAEAIPALIDVARTKPDYIYAAVMALGAIAPERPDVSAALVEAFTTKDYSTGMGVQEFVMKLSKTTVPQLKKHLAGDNAFARFLAAAALARLAPETPGLARVIDKPNLPKGNRAPVLHPTLREQLKPYRDKLKAE